MQHKPFCMGGSAPHISQQPERQNGIGKSCQDTPRRCEQHHAEGFLEQTLADVFVFEAQLLIELYLTLTLCKHFHQRIFHQQYRGENDEKAQ